VSPLDPADTKMQAQFDAFLAQHSVLRLSPAQREATWRYFQQQMATGR
jgi:hypothetical protein